MTERKAPAMASSSVRHLIGSWEFESMVEGRLMGRGTASFQWIEDGAFVLQRADDEASPEADRDWLAHSPMPMTSLIGFDDTALEHTMLYADARGVARVYRMTLTDRSWRIWRAAPGFNQRFIGAFRDDGRTVVGRWESSPDGSAWKPDFDMTYRKVDAPHRRRSLRPMSPALIRSLDNEPRLPHWRSTMTMTGATTHSTTSTLDVPGATLTYDVRNDGSTDAPVLFLFGSPMGASGFRTLAGHFPDRTVATYDPRGVERSVKTDPASPSTPDEHADDLHRVIQAIGSGPVDLFASSGGAVNALALVARHPEDVRTLVAHEPPLASILPDREGALAACRAIHESYQRRGFGAAMAHFIAVVGHKGPMTFEFAAEPGPDPAMFGMPAGDDGSRNDALFGQNILTCTGYEPDFDALRAASTRVVMAAGAESTGEMANRGAFAVAERLGTETVIFPSGHGGFLGGEYGQAGEPDAFAAKLREVLTQA